LLRGEWFTFREMSRADWFAAAKTHAWDWAIGSCVLAVLVAVTGTIVTYAIARMVRLK